MKIIISGCYGKMGCVLTETALSESDIKIICGIDNASDPQIKHNFPVFNDINDLEEKTDVIIDFSHPSALKPLLGWCILHKTPIVIATTGLGPEEHRLIQEASKQIPVFQTANMSLGINAVSKVLEILSNILGNDYDIEIIEKHHKYKKDSPSGTAYMLEDAIGHTCPTHSVRAGSIPGEHTIIFAGRDEVIELTHIAYSRTIFAKGALAAARFIIDQKPGIYNMKNLM